MSEPLRPWEQELADAFDADAEPCDEVSRLPDGTMRFQITLRLPQADGDALHQAAERMGMEIADYLLWCHNLIKPRGLRAAWLVDTDAEKEP